MFYVKEVKPSAKRGRCKRCSAMRAREWNLANRERVNANARRSHGKPEVMAKAKQWREANKEYLKAEVNKWRRENPEKWREIARRSRIKNMDKVLIRNREREILEVTAMPPWADRKKIRAIYEEAKRLTRETGIRHEVDHIYPLRGKYSCGLHVEYNLRIITGTENRKKFNKMPEEIAC